MSSNKTSSSKASKAPLALNCPSCQTAIEWSDDYPQRPFCSARCKQLDFCDWANEKHAIAGHQEIDDVFSEDLGETQ